MNLLRNKITQLETKKEAGMATKKDLKQLEEFYKMQGKKNRKKFKFK